MKVNAKLENVVKAPKNPTNIRARSWGEENKPSQAIAETRRRAPIRKHPARLTYRFWQAAPLLGEMHCHQCRGEVS